MDRKLRKEYALIIYFLQKRGKKLRIKEIIYCLQIIVQNAEYQLQFKHDDADIYNLVVDVLRCILIQEPDDFYQIGLVCKYLGMFDNYAWENFLDKLAKRLPFIEPDRKTMETLKRIFDLYLQYKYSDPVSKGNIIRVKNFIFNCIQYYRYTHIMELLQLALKMKFDLTND